jgi:1,4-dihydroxy-2-naphthoate octaprenyltransferase
LGEAKTRSWLHLLLFSSILAISLYVIFDLEYPRAGLIRIETADRVLRELRSSMK